MRKLRSKKGMTMAEVLAVVAILIILFGVAFIAVQRYQRSLGQLERDKIAKEIFVAAQNHLSAAYGAGYYGLKPSGAGDVTTYGYPEDADKGIYYYIVDGNIPANSVLELMLPFGAIDETVLAGGSYIIRYQVTTGTVLDVFYCTKNSSTSGFNHILGSGEYDTVKGLAGDDSSLKDARRTYAAGSNSILGWYGGAKVADIPTLELKPAEIEVKNEEKLYVKVTNPNTDPRALLQLIVTGVDSGAKKAIPLKTISATYRVAYTGGIFIVTLDDITRWDGITGMHFANLGADTGTFIPGEDIEIQAVAYSTEVFANIAYSNKGITNSLFGSTEVTGTVKDTAYITNIRHLENLDKSISNLGTSAKLNISKAIQTDNFSWDEFRQNILTIDGSGGDYKTLKAYKYNGDTGGCYIPIQPDYALTYDGNNHSISDVEVKNAGSGTIIDAGLFGATSTVTEIKNLELIDFKIAGTGNNGALAGNLSGTTVKNVLVRNENATVRPSNGYVISGSNAGGLIGKLSGGAVEYCGAAVWVNGSSTAGGLVGDCSGRITASFSGGHTEKGSYTKWIESNSVYDVTGGTVGGLVGSFTGTTIENSYSTCSVTGSTAGGFAGSASGTIRNSYCTGLVENTGSPAAFLASGGATLTGNYYYSIINEQKELDANGEVVSLLPVAGYNVESAADKARIKPIDLSYSTYDTFVGAASSWDEAITYDPILVKYYSGKYCLKSIKALNGTVPDDSFVAIHYGDWPAPEIFVVNN